MENYCAFSKDKKCLKWEDYLYTRDALAEADETCHGNWIEIERQYDYICTLQKILDDHGIDYPGLI